MKKYLKVDPWCIIEDDLDAANQKRSESIFSLGNGYMGHRATFEEEYSDESTYGNYIGGIYYPDPTKVGWWKNGYPKYFAKIVNIPNWLGIEVNIGTTEEINLGICKLIDFKRTLNMREGYLKREFTIESREGKQIKICAQRFVSMAAKELGAIKYSITPLNFSGDLTVTLSIDGDVKNETSYYDEYFWTELEKEALSEEVYLSTITKKTYFYLCTGMKFCVMQNNKKVKLNPDIFTGEKYAGNIIQLHCQQGTETIIYKYAAMVSSLHHEHINLVTTCKKMVNEACEVGYDFLFEEHKKVWEKIWQQSDVVIEGDPELQQAIRFNIFQLNQTYTGDDPRLNIGPKGFTGERYGGVTYWDTELLCIPFYLSTVGKEIAKNLLLYRYQQLGKAIENATNLGLKDGAALYPMVTINGEECHNEWEITLEEIHRNGAIAYAIYNYVRYTADKSYLVEYGLEVLIAISRFWKQRVTFSKPLNKYMLLGVTGPNEYESNVNNNWYTNTIATWTLQYTLDTLTYVKKVAQNKYDELIKKLNFDDKQETKDWENIINNMYYPKDEQMGIFLQQDGYLNKEQILVKDLNPKDRPLNQKWSWDRILRSCFIKQADVLQGIYFFEDKYSQEDIKRNFDFYEPRTVHESSLSAPIHSIIAAKLGNLDKAYELLARSARIDLDDYNNEVAEGCHVTGMGGSWLAIAQGFGGMRIIDDKLHFNPAIPKQWKSYSFKVHFRGTLLKIEVTHTGTKVTKEDGKSLEVIVKGKTVKL